MALETDKDTACLRWSSLPWYADVLKCLIQAARLLRLCIVLELPVLSSMLSADGSVTWKLAAFRVAGLIGMRYDA